MQNSIDYNGLRQDVQRSPAIMRRNAASKMHYARAAQRCQQHLHESVASRAGVQYCSVMIGRNVGPTETLNVANNERMGTAPYGRARMRLLQLSS